MSNVFLCSDWHLNHANILNFTCSNTGDKVRQFTNVDEMDEYIIAQHNKVVKPTDKVYHLGDVTFNKKSLYLVGRMNGDKVLIKGNHDVLPLKEYLPYFRDVRGSHQFDKMILTHIPIHPASLSRWSLGNVHGHLHTNKVMLPASGFGATPEKEDTRYYCVSMEQLDDYTPISLEQLKKNILERQAQV